LTDIFAADSMGILCSLVFTHIVFERRTLWI